MRVEPRPIMLMPNQQLLTDILYQIIRCIYFFPLVGQRTPEIIALPRESNPLLPNQQGYKIILMTVSTVVHCEPKVGEQHLE